MIPHYSLRQALAVLAALHEADDLDTYEQGLAIEVEIEAERLRQKVVALIQSYQRRQAAAQKEPNT